MKHNWQEQEFDFSFDDDKSISIDKKIRLITLFTGYDSQSMAMQRIGADFEIYKTCEWQTVATNLMKKIFHADDKTDYSKDMSDSEVIETLVKMGVSIDDDKPVDEKILKRKGVEWCRNTYNNYKACKNMGSITNIHGKDLEIVDKDKYCYILFYSFCCQDLSVAGKQKGMKKGSNTRSGLLWEVERLLQECKEYNGNLPDVLCLENVTQLHSKTNMPDFQEWINFLNSIGYKSFYNDLNSKNFGIPQNRDRTFMISILGDYEYEFPKEIPLRYCMMNLLEQKADDNFYINNDKSEKLLAEVFERFIKEDKIMGQPDFDNYIAALKKIMAEQQIDIKSAMEFLAK